MGFFGGSKPVDLVNNTNQQIKQFINQTYQEMFFDHCIKDYQKDLSEDEKVCLAKCYDNTFVYLK